MSRRTERVGSTIKRELQLIIMRELSDPRLVPMPTITRTHVTEDLSEADVYVTVMGSQGRQTAALTALRSAAGHMRKRLGEMLEMRTIPYIKFQLDENLKKELELMDVLDQVHRELEENERSRQPDTDSHAADAVDAADTATDKADPKQP